MASRLLQSFLNELLTCHAFFLCLNVDIQYPVKKTKIKIEKGSQEARHNEPAKPKGRHTLNAHGKMNK